MIRRILIGACAAASWLALGACTNAEEQAAIGGVQLACEAGPVIVSIATANAAIATMSTQAGQGCSAILTKLQYYIKQVTDAGGTAMVSVQQNNQGHRFSFKRGSKGMVMRDEDNKKVYVIQPGLFGF